MVSKPRAGSDEEVELGPASSCEASTATDAPALGPEALAQDAAESQPPALAQQPEARTDLAALPDAAIAEAFCAEPARSLLGAAATGSEGGPRFQLFR